MGDDKKEFLSLEEVADFLGVTYQLIYRLVRSGELPAVRLGKLYRVSRADLDAYLMRSRAAAGGGTCSVCGTYYKSTSSLKQTCTAEGCGEAICFDCWNRLGVRTCPKHSVKNTKA
ncbi:MAG: helix-turn-helix domain-containing protein [Kiritimatiellae bacterium]|nr:helix-turn-helix domain-containing protein [Kiritimatiellia bacterium]